MLGAALLISYLYLIREGFRILYRAPERKISGIAFDACSKS